MGQKRRDFVKQASFLGAGMIGLPKFAHAHQKEKWTPAIHVFSKHLQFLDYPEMAAAASQMGFDGVELTVRPNGHVLPENVERDLPIAVEEVRKQGLDCTMIVTAINQANETARKVLGTAADLGIESYRMGYYRYPDGADIVSSLQTFRDQAIELAKLNAELNIRGSYQNHAGNYVGASIWELYQLLEEISEEHIGAQYDFRHAHLEGGQSWENGLKLIRPRIISLVAKDYKWEKINSHWKVKNVPIGEGMVDFSRNFQLVREFDINVPITVHFEYDLHDENVDTERMKEQAMMHMKKDLDQIRKFWVQSDEN